MTPRAQRLALRRATAHGVRFLARPVPGRPFPGMPSVQWVSFRYLCEGLGNGECTYYTAPGHGVWAHGLLLDLAPDDLHIAAYLALAASTALLGNNP